MKRVFCLIFIFVYLCASCGATLHYNYKKGEFKKLAFWFNDANQCIKHGCKECHTVYELVIIKVDQTQVNHEDEVPQLSYLPLIFEANYTPVGMPALSKAQSINHEIYEPPLQPDIDPIVRDCKFLI